MSSCNIVNKTLPLRRARVQRYFSVSSYLFIYLFLDRGEGWEKEKERHFNVWLPLEHPLLGPWPANPGMCPDWESNQ